MKDVRKIASFGFALLAMFGVAGRVQGQTVITTGKTKLLAYSTTGTIGTVYQYGETTFAFTNCVSCGKLDLVAVQNGRGGTEIEVAEEPKTSDIFSNTTGNTGTGDTALSFTVTVGVATGNHGVSSVTNILLGSDTVTGGAATTANNAYVTSVLSNFVGATAAGTQKSDLSTTSSESTFSTVTPGHSFSFTDTLTDNSGSAASGYTLKLTNVRLLLNPAPEPASIALFATGLVGLTAARRRFSRRAKR